jgi:hypothetical protein
MPTIVELLQLPIVGSCGWPISSRVSQNIVACLQFKNNAPSSASAANATTNRNIAHKDEKNPIQFDWLCGIGFPFHEEVSACSAVCVCLG